MHPASHLPSRFESGTFPVPRNYNLRQMLYNDACSKPRDDPRQVSSDQLIPALPFSDVPVYADTVDIETLAFHNFWGCLLTPDNVAAGIHTNDLGYHVWVATLRVVESGLVKLTDNEHLVRAVMDQFMVELGLVLLDLCPGPLVLFVDPRLHDDADAMVSRAIATVAKFDEAHVRRWRVVVTLPATEDGIRAAQVLTSRHGIHTHLSLVSCLAHAATCIEAGAKTVSMSVDPIMSWFEQQRDARAAHVSPDHPGIETIQSCATFIRRHGINTTLLTTDVREWAVLKQLGSVGATALRKDQLDQIPMQRITTWHPRPDDASTATQRALQAEYPPRSLDPDKGFLRSLPADAHSLVSAVLYARLAKMAAQMDTIEKVVKCEIKRRVRLETVPLEQLYRRPSPRTETPRSRKSTSRKPGSKRSTSRSRRRSTGSPEKRSIRDTLVDGVDYF